MFFCNRAGFAYHNLVEDRSLLSLHIETHFIQKVDQMHYPQFQKSLNDLGNIEKCFSIHSSFLTATGFSSCIHTLQLFIIVSFPLFKRKEELLVKATSLLSTDSLRNAWHREKCCGTLKKAGICQWDGNTGWLKRVRTTLVNITSQWNLSEKVQVGRGISMPWSVSAESLFNEKQVVPPFI